MRCLNPNAVFFDRDGTINAEVNYLGNPEQLSLLYGTASVLRHLKKRGIKSIIVTNQAGIAKGLFTEEDLMRVNNRLIKLLSEEGVAIDALYYCPHHPEGNVSRYRINCNCRKPSPGMIYKACKDFKIDPKKCWLVGDKLSDIGAGSRAGCITFLVLTGYGIQEIKKIISKRNIFKPDFVIPKLTDLLNYL
ncbi:D-glycero-alpha-D-manno-heptose-1,7-bisphosphate 7-phosphatase [Pelotomaculum propionicicum]|uniref:D,D-heptose 1,7-bisphosphate phosphatase n=1 Tax=Pelotomaculum propionicicum TaxID=258475 RepID=A0A4Y7RKZ4_9FIRM|nr:HAD family hydrolase [Pelotomaculum propionicicum]NLI11053.1 HAD family hydrolase [Peptococcaceae bacterium]TEB09533.1 D-glycero-alpha-D-manno-heptose-1,7-bisphosphate 7-phosphatase [Pelotomaculum propionicicum]